MTKPEIDRRARSFLRHSNFVIPSEFAIRISTFPDYARTHCSSRRGRHLHACRTGAAHGAVSARPRERSAYRDARDALCRGRVRPNECAESALRDRAMGCRRDPRSCRRHAGHHPNEPGGLRAHWPGIARSHHSTTRHGDMIENDEFRMTKPESMTNDETRYRSLCGQIFSSFELRHSFDIRRSEFVISCP